MDLTNHALNIFLSGVDSVIPDKIITNKMALENNHLLIDNKIICQLNLIKNLYVIGAGKASAYMAKAVEKMLNDKITGGLVITKYGYGCRLKKIKMVEAGHPTPDLNGIEATKKILEIAQNAGANDLVICLISGGGSSLLSDLPENTTLKELIALNEMLIRSGADIQEINTVRKQFSNVKGGKLAAAVYPATLVTLILSDVNGDPLDIIASGPTCRDTSTVEDAIDVLMKYQLLEKIPGSLLTYLTRKFHHVTLKAEDAQIFQKVTNCIVGNNRIALKSARLKAIELGYDTSIIETDLKGSVTDISGYILKTLRAAENNSVTSKKCLLFGGEPTIEVRENGLGGRNQHLALLMADAIKGMNNVTILCAGTDGSDGPTDAAGAIVSGNTCETALSHGIDYEDYIRNFDSYHFFQKAGGHVVTGPTNTNVMDIIVVLIEKPTNKE